MKKITTVLLALLLVLGLTACNPTPLDPADPSGPTDPGAATDPGDGGAVWTYPDIDELEQNLTAAGYTVQRLDTVGFEGAEIPALRLYAQKGDAGGFDICYGVDEEDLELIGLYYADAMPNYDIMAYVSEADIAYCAFGENVLPDAGFPPGEIGD